MSTQLLDVQPRQLKFAFEVKKQSSCTIQLANVTGHLVAFKVKTTSPKKYCVRPNTGIIKPYSKCDFTVILLAQKSAPSGLLCKDKFLIQSTILPLGTNENDISSGMFSKDSGKQIEERKLKVVLINAPTPYSPIPLPVNGVTKQELSLEVSVKEKLPRGNENLLPFMTFQLAKASSDVKVEGLKRSFIENVKPSITQEKLEKDVEELKSKLNAMELKLSEAGFTIRRLSEERSTDIQESEKLKQKMTMLRRKKDTRRVHDGFPFLFVCMVALIGLALGYTLRI